ncbi:MAG: translation initiation factor IF-2 [Alphaproteobacteria bacterium]|nr:translation initiation factor IF-2 [Alphaproteobacteria bacterium]
MTESKEKETSEKKTLSLKGGTLSLKGGNTSGRPMTTQGATVEVRRDRSARPVASAVPVKETPAVPTTQNAELRNLTTEEREARARALKEALAESDKKKPLYEQPVGGKVTRAAPITTESKEDEARRKELEELQRIEAEEKRKSAALEKQGQDQFRAMPIRTTQDEELSSYRDRNKKAPRSTRGDEDDTRNNSRRGGKLTVTQVLNEQYEREREMSLAARRRAQEKARKAAMGPKETAQKILREVIIPETITVQELSNRMAERGADVIKSLMKLGVMATINHTIDADTAELIVSEFGHTFKRVTDADVEDNLNRLDMDTSEGMVSRPPVVTIMGHVDHGKTSLLDAMRSTNVVSGEAGGITQHIGAYQVTLPSGAKITFLDTPGHAAFTEMRARGANVTDIVVLVVAANDSIMPQTIEAINHAKAAKVPIIVAINKIDLPDANPSKVKQDLLSHEIVVEDMGGDTQVVEISAKKRINLDKLEETILLQAEILELKANPSKPAMGAVVESKMETGRGSVATVLVQSGTLKVGDIFVVGSEWGRVRALYDDKGLSINSAEPGKPVEVLGLQGTPDAGDVLNVVENEAKAREVASYRARKKREKLNVTSAKGGMTLDDMLAAAKEAGARQTLPVLIKGDVHGSVEAIIGSLNKMAEENTEIGVHVLHSGVGAITESDITLAKASKAVIIGFNVRANAQARQQAERDGVDIRYYNIIYNVINDAKAILSGMLSPTRREEYLGQASVRQVFNITKVGKIAGCMVTAGVVKRGAKVRLLRDHVVIHEGTLKTLKRFKDEVKEVKEGMECGMAFENYDDLKDNDVIECYEIIEEARTLA